MDLHFNSIDQRFDSINQRFDGIDQCFDGIDQHFDSINLHLNGIDLRLTRVEVLIENLRIVQTNHHRWALGSDETYHSHKKEIVGSRTALAQQIHGTPLPLNVDIDPPADVGTAPPPPPPPPTINPLAALNMDILRLITFYNDKFDIEATNQLPHHRAKLLHWMMDNLS
ncbi:hypothetical protein JB92DRAFT_3119539 [Gautieria morchelliformis]|nr:hypothetical protein JB92DRAFT_3119539 [Gautieria morchelliformis]